MYIDGIALWTPRLPGWELARAVFRGESEAPPQAAPRPAPTLLAPTERRRAPDTVAIALEVASRACEAAGRDPATLASVFASTHGDLAINDYMCETLAQSPAQLSPTRFHNSVHNAASGYWTIGNGCNAPTVALAAFTYTFATGLLEAATQVACEGQPVLLVAYDIEARGPLATVCDSRGQFGAALLLAPARGERSIARMGWRVAAREDGIAEPLATHHALVAGNPLAASLGLFEALARGESRCVRQELSPRQVLELEVQPCPA